MDGQLVTLGSAPAHVVPGDCRLNAAAAAGIQSSFAVLKIRGKVWRIRHRGEEIAIEESLGTGRDGRPLPKMPVPTIDVVVVGTSHAISKRCTSRATTPPRARRRIAFPSTASRRSCQRTQAVADVRDLPEKYLGQRHDGERLEGQGVPRRQADRRGADCRHQQRGFRRADAAGYPAYLVEDMEVLRRSAGLMGPIWPRWSRGSASRRRRPCSWSFPALAGCRMPQTTSWPTR